MTHKRLIQTIGISVGLTVMLLVLVAAVRPGPCERNPEDPRCGGTTTTTIVPPTTTTTVLPSTTTTVSPTTTTTVPSSGLTIPATQEQTISGFNQNDSFRFLLGTTSFDYLAHGMPYMYSEAVPGNHDHAWWEDGDREGYRCAYAFLYDKHPNPFGEFGNNPRPAKFIAQAVVARAVDYVKVNDKYMEEGQRYFDGTVANEGGAEIQDPNEASDCALEASLLVPGFDYDTYVPHGVDAIRVGLFRADGEISDIRDFTDLGHFEFVSFDGNLVQIVFVSEDKATHAIYYRTMNDGQMAIEVNGELVTAGS